jgi:hypothetical protein
MLSPFRGIVFMAVSHHKDLDISRQIACDLPVGLLQRAHKGTSLEVPILLELADKIPAIIAELVEELVRRILRVKEGQLELTAQAIAHSSAALRLGRIWRRLLSARAERLRECRRPSVQTRKTMERPNTTLHCLFDHTTRLRSAVAHMVFPRRYHPRKESRQRQ